MFPCVVLSFMIGGFMGRIKSEIVVFASKYDEKLKCYRLSNSVVGKFAAFHKYPKNILTKVSK